MAYGNTVLDQSPQKLAALGIQSAASIASLKSAPLQSRLLSTIPLCNRFFEGGLPMSSVCEWGTPIGTGGRELILSFLATGTQDGLAQPPLWTLWVQTSDELCVYPPAWQARGVNLHFMRFAHSEKPARDLRQVFLDGFFKIIVLDGGHYNDEEWVFFASQARRHRLLVLVLNNEFLKATQGNVWAKLRVNCHYDTQLNGFCLRVIRGLSPRQILLPDSLHSESAQIASNDRKENQ